MIDSSQAGKLIVTLFITSVSVEIDGDFVCSSVAACVLNKQPEAKVSDTTEA
ncbi:hypothetical protein I5907_14375 [Panacibacter sp. DH6]|uniref:Uncharacterized protein n=1 Tax=Panacibacter microcysteis TaxID=2793269 RepID=A0A931GV54_9BACT|nr:hypothetical protein [Panacibacter microcysteis]MBG9377426.1 hypothetical protein [Panacibacter microcysteis]